MKMINFPSIEQFRNVIRTVRNNVAYVGKDDNGEAILDHSRLIPTLRFHGTVKLHGTNSCVAQSNGERWFQSRSRIITPLNDNAGFAFWATANEDKFDALFAKFPAESTVAVFGEMAGQGIQSGVGVAQIPKNFYIFAIQVDDEWLSPISLKESVAETGLTCIEDFQTFDIDIDFNHPEIAQNELIKIVEEVERLCPVSHALGVDGIGEGVVFCLYRSRIYKI